MKLMFKVIVHYWLLQITNFCSFFFPFFTITDDTFWNAFGKVLSSTKGILKTTDLDGFDEVTTVALRILFLTYHDVIHVLKKC